MKPSKLLLLLASLAAAGGLRAEIVERVIARVNGDVVTLSEFEARQLAAVQQARIAPSEVERYLRGHIEQDSKRVPARRHEVAPRAREDRRS